MSTLRDFHFLYPWLLLGLCAVPLFCWLGLRRGPGRLQLQRLADAALLPRLLRGRARNRHLPLLLFVLGWTLAVVAFAGPAWNRVSQPLYARRAAQVVALSLSRHMLARDVAPSRLDRARFKARDLLDSNKDGLNGLVGYAGEAFVVAPLTSDAKSLNDLLGAMAPDTMPVDGDNAAAAIQLGAKLIHNANAASGSVVLITDNADASAQAAARTALAGGVHVSVLGVGSEHGGPVPVAEGGFLHDGRGDIALAPRDDAALSALATAGGGQYVPMRADHADIDRLHATLQASETVASKETTSDQWRDRGPWLLLPLLLLVAVGFRRGWLLLLVLAALPLVPARAHATSWVDLWQRPDQRAAQALRQGHPEKAQALAADPAWRGSAAYRAGHYADAAQAFKQVQGTDAAYNRGNALARTEKYQQALQAYDQALKLDPSNADAKANRKAVEDWLKRQQQKKQQGKQEKNDKGKSSDKKGQDKSGESSGKNKNGKNTSSQDDKPKNRKDGRSPGQSDQHDASRPQDRNGSQQEKDQPKPQTAKERAEAKARAEQAKKAMQKQMDEALAQKGNAAKNKPPTHDLGAPAPGDSSSRLPADLRHALQRVPDDPGELLRRKFELEYQERHGGAQNPEEQP